MAKGLFGTSNDFPRYQCDTSHNCRILHTVPPSLRHLNILHLLRKTIHRGYRVLGPLQRYLTHPPPAIAFGSADLKALQAVFAGDKLLVLLYRPQLPKYSATRHLAGI